MTSSTLSAWLKRRWLSLTLAILALAGALALSMPRDGETLPPESESTSLADVQVVRVAPVLLQEVERGIRLSGVTRAVQAARLALTVGGRLEERPVEVGDRVRSGQLLARLDARELAHAVRAAEARLAELEAQLAQQERERRRSERLLESKAATREEAEQSASAVDTLAAAREAAATQLAEARRQQAETVLRAPFAGTVVAVYSEPGEHVTSGSPVVEISGEGPMELVVEAPEKLLSLLSPGREVEVELPSIGRTATGRIAAVTRGSGAGRLFPVRIVLEGEGAGTTGEHLFSGLTAEVVLATHGARELTVPLEAVINPGGSRPVVFRVREAEDRSWVAERVAVEILDLAGDRVGVTGLLTPEDRVVVAGHALLVDGDPIRLQDDRSGEVQR